MEKKNVWREKWLRWKNRRKTKRLPFTRSSPPPNLRHVQSTLVRSEWLQNNIFWTRTTTKTGGIHFGRACMIVCLDQNWTFLILRLLMLSVNDVKQPPQPQDAEASSGTNTERSQCIPPSCTHPRSAADVH